MIGKLLIAGSLATCIALPAGGIGTAYAQEDADKQAALAAYKKGTIQYNLGNWDKAIGFFKTAFETYPDAAFLFNIAQSYRQAADCKQSVFFYERYLAIKPTAANREEVEGFISELDAECAGRTTGTGTTGTGTGTTGTGTTGTGTTSETGTTSDTGTGTETTTATSDTETGTTGGTQVADSGDTTASISGSAGAVRGSLRDDSQAPTLVMAYGSVGPSMLGVGDLETSPQFNVTLGAGYPISLGKITVDAGALLGYTPVNWDSPSASGTATFTALLVNVGTSMEVMPKVRVRGELGVGTMIYSGLDVPGNVFVDDGLMATGAVSSASFRVAIGGEYAITDAIAVSAQPVVLSVSPAPAGMRRSIDNVSSYQALIGVGYKM